MDPVTLGITLVDGDGSRRDVKIAATPDTPISEILDACGAPTTGWCADDTRLDPESDLGSSPLFHGAILDRTPRDAHGGRTVEFQIRTGAEAGRSFRLGEGQHQIGRALGAVQIEDPSVSRLHAELLITGTSVSVRDLGGRNGTGVNGVQITDRREITEQDFVSLGDVELSIRPHSAGDASLEVDADQRRIIFNRPGRFRKPRPTLTVERDRDATEANMPSFPWTTLFTPIAMGLLYLTVFGPSPIVFMAGIGPIAAIAQYATSRRKANRQNEEAAKNAATNLELFAIGIAEAVEVEREWLESGHPPLAEVLDIARLPTTRLWERRPDDHDFLTVRVGTVDLPSDVRVEGIKMEQLPTIPDAPALLDLKGAGVTGIAGPAADVGGVARALLTRIAVLHAPTDVQVVVLAQPAGDTTRWDWAKWLPHTGGPFPAISDSAEARAALIEDLAATVRARTELLESRKGAVGTHILVVAETPQALREIDDFLTILGQGPQVGILTLALEHDSPEKRGEAKLPAESKAQLLLDNGGAVLQRKGEDDRPGITSEALAIALAEEAARALGPRALAGEDSARFPASVRLLDLLELPDEPGALQKKWLESPPVTEAVFGVTESAPFSVDIVNDGPHALIAGTTGSGKTELLQSLLGALAAGNAPDRLGFLLVDYKGGGDFADLARLPHTLGLVSNLDEALTRRAVVALRAEMERRQNTLAELREQGLISEANVKSAWREQPKEASRLQLGRLVIVVDEFALFKKNLPSFVDGLVQLTQQGRSLGMHLILAVQSATGVVTNDIRANTSLRIVMRTVKGESQEVLESKEADFISKSTPGRGYARVGDPPVLTEFQSARVGGLRPVTQSERPKAQATPFAWGGLAGGVGPDDEGTGQGTDLAALVGFLTEACEGLDSPPNPWPDPLPTEIAVADLPLTDSPIPWAQVDRPGSREVGDRIGVTGLDPSNSGHVAVVGPKGSGRTMALRSLVESAVSKLDPDECQFIAIDLDRGRLRNLEQLTAYLAPVATEAGHAERYIEALVTELEERRRGIRPVRPTVVLVDRLDSLLRRSEPGSDLELQLRMLMQEGPNVGILLVATGDETLLGRYRDTWSETLLLGLSDRSQFREYGIDPKSVPDELPAGRGFLASTGEMIQIALASDELPVSAAEPPPDRLAVAPLPTSVSIDRALEMIERVDGMVLPIGVGGPDSSLQEVDLEAAGGGFVVGGRRGTGKSTALRWFALASARCGIDVVAISGSRSGSLGHLSEIEAHTFGPDLDLDQLLGALDTLTGRTLILIDDAPALARRAKSGMATLEAVRHFVEGRGTHRAAVVVSGSLGDLSESQLGAIGLATRSEAGLLFAPSSLEARSFGVRELAERHSVAGSPGSGILAQAGRVTEIVVPLGHGQNPDR